VVSLFVNDFIIKETRRTLKMLHFSEENINYAVDYVMECCIVRRNVSKKELLKYNIRDKNDIPILAGAVRESAELVTEDGALRVDAKGYIESLTPSEALKKLGDYGK
ncbi:MAG: hypothetical protein KAJ55_12620, partial [Anaerolineales bacterium]|nr:hypothetical protein [Anaerolineales bacterium]